MGAIMENLLIEMTLNDMNYFNISVFRYSAEQSISG